ncbi:MAG: DEAD/DEAH box helicase, partial [Planctomycetota bacterium]
TPAQCQAWPPISSGENTLLLAPTGSGKTLAAFLVAINRIMFPAGSEAPDPPGIKTLYLSPLKALGVDVERNLRAPLAGVAAVAAREGFEFHLPTVGVRSGDTPANERARMTRQPPDILISTPESLYLMLTSRAREILRTVDTVIIDEIHSVVGTKRGSHLFLSLERLEDLRLSAEGPHQPLQRIGLSATQRPLEEVARLLGGAERAPEAQDTWRPRPVEIVQAGRTKTMQIQVEVPVEDMAKLGEPELAAGPAAAGPTIPSIWPSIHPRLVELIRAHRSTMIFVNSRRLAERMSAAINEVADEEIALAHHGSIAKEQRLAVEDRLKRGSLPAIVATSSLELGIDMGAVDLVIQIESPPSIASAVQRIGRAGHQVGVPSKGTIFPKYRGDLLACSAAVERMHAGQVEQVFYPRNPLDVLAQQLVAMVALEPRSIDDLFDIVRRAAPFTELTRNLFESVLDLLAGRYPSNEFAELRPRINWDRGSGLISPRKGSQRIAITNGGTIPDRGLYGVFLVTGEDKAPNRVGELDEEMVFETRPGDVFLLGATAWRAIDITHDRVLVEPAPGEPGRMPFWRGDGPGRPLEFGQAIGKLTAELAGADRSTAESRLVSDHGLEQRAAWNLMNYIDEQSEATGEVPSDRTVVIERFVDEIGDWRVVVMTPFGSRIHAPWATAVITRLREEIVGEIDMMWSDDGMVFRIPRTDADAPATELFLPRPDEVEDVVVRELGGTALFAARFRENAARALLLPRRRPGQRTPLWLQRRKSADLLNVASRYERFPIMLETYRECLRDVFDLPGLKSVLRDITRRKIRVHAVETTVASPFAASLLFSYTGNFLYDGDAPLAERRAATLALDHNQLRELLGDAELRRLLDPAVIDELQLELQRIDGRYPVKDGDGIRDLLRLLGDLTEAELKARTAGELDLPAALDELVRRRKLIQAPIGGELRYLAAEDAGRYRDALGVVPPQGLPEAFLESVPDALVDLVGRYARTHVPFR